MQTITDFEAGYKAGQNNDLIKLKNNNMENQWTDNDLRVAYEDGCKFENFNDLQRFLITRWHLVKPTETTKSKEPKQSIIWLIIGRTLGFPFFVGIALVGALIMFLKWVVNYILFGGESIAYTRKTDRKTIHDIYIELIKKQSDEQTM
jgi:hypothetical protein